MINVITLDREYGSGGAAIARKLAERLGWKLYDQLLTDGIARFINCRRSDVEKREEKRDPLYYRLLKSFMRGSFEGNLNAPNLGLLDADRIFSATKCLVERAAEEGRCVIVGRGSALFLRERNDAYHVFVYAPAEDKIQRLCRAGESEAAAAALVKSVDRERAAFVKRHFDIEWPATRSSYHLMINTHAGEDAAVEMILKGVAIHDKASNSAQRI
jgi:cytidylate kinase